MKSLFSSLFHATLDACFPTRCVLCGQQAFLEAWCRACYAALPRLGAACPRCALPTHDGKTCGACLHLPPPFDTTLAACRYTFPLDRLLQDFKYGHRLALAAPLAQPLIDAYRVASSQPSFQTPTHLIAMPLSSARQIERGFNQAQELARKTAQALQLPLLHSVLHRIRESPKQATLSWRERHKNVRGAFACEISLKNHSIALIDDVMTTGATVAAAAQALRHAGAPHVSVWVIARAVPDDAHHLSF